MWKNTRKLFLMVLVTMFVCSIAFEYDAFARAGGGRSSGSSGSRSYSSPARSSSNPAVPSQPSSPSAPAQPAGGGFLKGMGGGLLGGLLGGMLIGSLFGFGGAGMGGSGFGILEIILLGAVGYFIFTIVRKRKEAALAYQGAQRGNYPAEDVSSYGKNSQMVAEVDSASQGIAHIRQMDPAFDADRFKDTAMDMFFKIQGAWGNRNLSSVTGLLTDEMKGFFQQDLDKLLQEKKINRLENIAVRKVEALEAWQETGQDFIRILFTANLLDYTVDESTGAVLAGSKTDPVKFEECWTFCRPVGNNSWKLTAIDQV